MKMSIGECQVCGNSSEGFHFGAEACKACAAFFRRSIVYKKKYVCRGQENCAIKHNKHFKCRFCRLRQCYAAGMKKQQVQNRAVDSDSDTLEDEERDCVPSTSSTPPNKEDVKPDINRIRLNLIVDEYSVFNNLIFEKEQSVIENEEFITGIASIEPGLYPSNFKLTNTIMRVYMESLPEFVAKAFPRFTELTEDEKLLIFPDFVSRLLIMENLTRTAKRTTSTQKRFLITRTTFIDINEPEHVYGNCQLQLHKMDKQEVNRLMQNNMMKSLNLIEQIREMELEDIEIGCIVGLLLWNPNLTSISSRLNRICKEERAIIVKGLCANYIESLGSDEYGIRMGEVLCLLSQIQFTSSYVREDMELLKLFDAFETDSFICGLLAA